MDLGANEYTDLQKGDAAADRARDPGGGAPRLCPLGGRLRDHQLQCWPRTVTFPLFVWGAARVAHAAADQRDRHGDLRHRRHDDAHQRLRAESPREKRLTSDSPGRTSTSKLPLSPSVGRCCRTGPSQGRAPLSSELAAEHERGSGQRSRQASSGTLSNAPIFATSCRRPAYFRRPDATHSRGAASFRRMASRSSPVNSSPSTPSGCAVSTCSRSSPSALAASSTSRSRANPAAAAYKGCSPATAGLRAGDVWPATLGPDCGSACVQSVTGRRWPPRWCF